MHVKVCGITTVDDALGCVEAGVSSIGVNFVPESPRRVSVETARAIAEAVGKRALVVGVVADLPLAALIELREGAKLGCLQLHGDEAPEALLPLLPHAYKALRIGDADDVRFAERYPGEYLLVDAKVPGALGGTGKTLDFSLVAKLAETRKLTLAGGLTPENVAEAVRAVRPFCVDVASGVERSPGIKDLARVAAFVRAAREA
jgi:phosphoribosylanthranilate isomerase